MTSIAVELDISCDAVEVVKRRVYGHQVDFLASQPYLLTPLPTYQHLFSKLAHEEVGEEPRPHSLFGKRIEDLLVARRGEGAREPEGIGT